MLTDKWKLICDYCGQIIEPWEFETGRARNVSCEKWDGYYDNMHHDIHTFHVICKEKDRRLS